MRLTLVGIGSRGDVAPLITLGHGLAAHGHVITVLANQEFEGLAVGADVAFVAARGKNPRELLEGPEGREFLRKAKTPQGYAKRFAEIASTVVEIGFEDTLEASREADAILYQPTAFGGFNVAEKLGIAAVQVQLQPFLRTRQYPSVFVPRRTLGPVGNLTSHIISERMLSYALREPLNRARDTVLSLPPITSRNAAGDRARLDAGRLLGFSRHVVPPSPTWPANTFQCGFWMDAVDPTWTPDAATRSFLGSHDRPTVLFSLGSMVVDDPVRLTNSVVQAAAMSGHRLLFQRGWAGLGDGVEEQEHVHVIGDVPHDAVFALVDGVVHHGGAGTMARALRCGRPSMAIPVIADQWFWGHRIASLGAGPAPLSADKVTAKALASRLTKLTGDPGARERAEAIGAQLRAEDAITPAVDALRQLKLP